jgi:Glycosyl transferase family 90
MTRRTSARRKSETAPHGGRVAGGALVGLLVGLYAAMGVLWERPAFSRNGSSTKQSALPEKKKKEKTRTFPKWGRTVQDEQRDGMALSDLLHFLFHSSQFAATTTTKDSSEPYRPLQDHGHDLLGRLPETLYVVAPGGRLYMSQMHRDLQQSIRDDKLNHTERLMLQALQRLHHETDSCAAHSAWPHLCQALAHSGGGFPFLAWYGDYTGCNYENGPERPTPDPPRSIPLFTVAADVHCPYTWPWPNYYHIKSLLPTTNDWDAVLALYAQQYPWPDQIRRVGWRGSLTGNIGNATTKCPRWNLLHAVQQSHRSDLWDVAITQVPPRARHQWQDAIAEDIGLPGGRDDLLKFLDFQRYRAILDIDGNSWSGRFGSLLCFNSVVLKVEPTYVDYFYHKYRNPNVLDEKEEEDKYVLQPWKQYIPIRDDFSDLQQQAEFALDPANEATIQQIIRNAHDWCRHTMIESVVWDRYVQLLGVHDAQWPALWQEAQTDLMAAASPFQMVELFRADYPAFQNVAVFPK